MGMMSQAKVPSHSYKTPLIYYWVVFYGSKHEHVSPRFLGSRTCYNKLEPNLGSFFNNSNLKKIPISLSEARFEKHLAISLA